MGETNTRFAISKLRQLFLCNFLSGSKERKRSNGEQPVSLEPFTTLFNRLIEEIIFLRSYVNEQLENV